MATKYAYLKLFMLESVDEEESRPEAVYSQKKPYFNMAKSEPVMNSVKDFLADRTKGKSAEEKTAFLKEKFNVTQFADLNKLSEAELTKRLENAKK